MFGLAASAASRRGSQMQNAMKMIGMNYMKGVMVIG